MRTATALIAIALVTAWASATEMGSFVSSFESPCNDRVDGIGYHDGLLYHANYNGPAEVIVTRTGGAVVSSLPDPRYAVDVDYTGSAYWVYSRWSQVPFNRIVQMNGAGSVVETFAAPTNGEGITYGGGYLWYSTGGNHNWNYVYQLDASASVVSSFQAPHGLGYTNRGIDWDGEALFVVQDGASGGYVYRMTTTGSVLNSHFIEFGGPTGVAWDGRYLWLSDKNTEWVYRMTWTDVAVEPASLGKVRALFR
ncbi:MAG: hypothetical protein PVH29_09360 [Candidatus Zixiibacteriota bacterium]|jgi:hypothetical protein